MPTTTVTAGFNDLKFRYLCVGASDVQWDSSFGLNLHYMHARHYSSTLGRFLQPDPARADAMHYGYAGNNAVSASDPGGMVTINPGQNLNPALQAYCESSARHQTICGLAQYARTLAERRMFDLWPRLQNPSRQNPSWDGGQADAFRHCCWNAMMVHLIGVKNAKHIADDLYELQEPITSRNTQRMRDMDLSNNAMGRYLGQNIPTVWNIFTVFGAEVYRLRDYAAEFNLIAGGCWAFLKMGIRKYAHK